ncbi:MAG: alpha-amylase family glycosyl hydrolase [Meiothermus sp.]|nr:alpha-amylase family glycosyl hydrolase [Meiothermus sp.]
MTPAWVKDAVFYQIFPDRFARGRGPVVNPAPARGGFEGWEASPTLRGFKGGNLWGVIEKLDYIKAQGFNAIYFCPVFSSTANHRYHTSDYFLVDPMLGGNEALKRLVDEAHDRGIRVVLDGVFNHCGRAHFAFQHVLENGAASPYRDWFHIHKFPLYAYGDKPNYSAWWGNAELPKFNTANPECREYLLSVAEYWFEYGIDGWRLDVPNEIDDDAFWREFRRRVKARNPEAYIVGEIWDDAHRWLQGDQFDAVMNYPLGRAILGLVGGEVLDRDLAAKSGLGRLESLGALAASHRLEGLFERYNWDIVTAQMNIMSSHDTPRLISLMRGDARRAALALAVLFTLPGVPTVYYGDEVGLAGGHDPDNRRGMPWDEGQWNQEILGAVQKLGALRAEHPVLRHGRYQRLYAQDNHLAYARVGGDQTLIVTVNATPNPWRVSIPHHGLLSKGEVAVDLVSGNQGRVLSNHLEDGELEGFGIGVWQVR